MKKTSYCEATISLTILEAGAIDSGQYRLKVSNELNEVSSETALIVKREYRDSLGECVEKLEHCRYTLNLLKS